MYINSDYEKMDKFVVRKKRDNGIDKPLEKERKCLKQATIDSLKVNHIENKMNWEIHSM